MRWKRKKYRMKQVIAASLLVLFALFYADITMFQHTHIINGITIVHSHFHTKAHEQTPTGGHTETEITFIAIASLFQTFEDVLIHFDTTLFLIFCGIVLVYVETEDTKDIPHLSFLRAPPTY